MQSLPGSGFGVFSPDGQMFAAVRNVLQEPGAWLLGVRVWDVGTWSERALLRTGRPADVLAFSPDGRLLAVATDNGIQLWDTTTWRERTRLAAHSGPVQALAFCPEGRSLLSAGGLLCPLTGESIGGEARLWDVVRERAATVTGPGAFLTAAFTPNGQEVILGDQFGQVLAWPGGTAAPRVLFRQGPAVRCLAVSPNGTLLATTAGARVRLWHLGAGEPGGRLGGDRQPVRALAFAPDGRGLAAASAGGNIRFWDVASAEERAWYATGQCSLRWLSFSHNGNLLAAAGSDLSVLSREELETGRRRGEAVGGEADLAGGFGPECWGRRAPALRLRPEREG